MLRVSIRLLAGCSLFRDSSPDTVAFVFAFAAGAILTMIANTVMPEAFEHDDPRTRLS
jgi:zinc transporter, ZIP family